MEEFGHPPSMQEGYNDNSNTNENYDTSNCNYEHNSNNNNDNNDHHKLQECMPNLEVHHLHNDSQLQLQQQDGDPHNVTDQAVQQAVHAAMDEASSAPAPLSITESIPTFADLDGGNNTHHHHVVMEAENGNNLSSSSDAFLDPPPDDDEDHYAHQYTSASVPVPPMMDWDHAAHHHDNGQGQLQDQLQVQTHAAAPNQIGNSMDLHSPIVASAAEPLHAPTDPADSSATAAAPLPPNNHGHHHNNAPPPPSSEPMYTSYAIAPGPPPPPHHHHHPHHAMPPHPSPAPHAAPGMPSHYDPHVQQHAMYAHYPPHAYAMPPPQAPHQGQMIPPYAAAAIPKTTSHSQTNHNSNFWLQEEEERFLLGLRLYGWGQWKRIQTIVQTRSNKQIKSHAQKREKVNPEIKYKYAKGKSRRGRISSKVLATEYSSGTEQDAAAAAATSLNDPRLPPMEELWKDVYGTNNGVGPNSRLRRYRSNALHQKWLEEVADKPEAEQQDPQPMATEKKMKSPMSGSSTEPIKQEKPSASALSASAKKKLTPEGQYIHDHKVLERHAMVPQQPSPGPPMPYYNAPPPPPHGHHYPPHPNYAMPPPGVSPTRMHPPGPAYPPPGYPMGHHHPSMPPPHPPIIHHGSAPVAATAPAPIAQAGVVMSNEEPLRPGMRVYARSKNSPLWCPGVIYSAKVDPNKSIDPNQAAVPLVYHVQYDGGEEDPEVQEEYILGKARYEKALEDLEAYYDLSMGRARTNPAPLEGGLPVYAQWIERSNPTSHARWLPGTIDSVRKEETPNGPIYTYHILFDNAAEKSDVSSECVLERNEYHELVKHKHHYPQTDASSSSRTPIGEIYNLFSRGDANSSGSGQGMDLLFTASQMAAPMDTLKKRDATSMMKEEEGEGAGGGGGDAASKRIKTEQQENLTMQHEETVTL
eukprot:CCRYP_016675-RA/>CCRYP_016675-RA protein AED:0.00 eAED:0.00 QI:745/-1/1/1/-1/1/1/336/920